MRHWLALLPAALLGIAMSGPRTAAAQTTPGGYAAREDVRSFARELAERDGFDEAALVETLSGAEFRPDILRIMEPLPSGRRSWKIYRSRFVNERRIRSGVSFWRDHEQALARAARDYAVPEPIIVAIIGVETEYGRNMGDYRVLDALATLAFDYPRRASFFRSELEHFLLFAREENIVAAGPRGSYAGAMGIPQFMPGSVRKWGVDFDGDGRRDLTVSAEDAIGSVANFLRAHGWESGQETAVPARVSGRHYLPLLELGVQPFVAARDLHRYGVTTLAAVDPDSPVALIELESPNAHPQYYLGLHNFYVLTRYNQSSFYAMSVIDLARAIGQREGRRLP